MGSRYSFILSVDAVPPNINLNKIKSVITSVPDGISVHHVHVWAMSTTENALTAHVQLPNELSGADKFKVEDVRHELEHAGIAQATIEIDPPKAGKVVELKD